MVTDYYLPTLGGVQTVIKAHREELERAGHEVRVFAPARAASADPGVVRLPTARGFAPDGYPFAWPPRRVAEVLRHELAAMQADVVHVHTEMFAALGAFRAARDLGLPIVQTMHGRIDVYTRAVLPAAPVTTTILAALHRRGIPHRASGIDGSAAYARTRTARRMWRLMVSQADAADRVIVPSAHFASKLLAQGVRTPITVLSNGLEDSVLDAIGEPSPGLVEHDGPLRVLWCGRLSPEKRPEVFVEAIAELDGVRAEMYGDGIARGRIARLAARLPSDRLRVHGAVPQRRVLDAMRTADVLVSSSLDFDNQPMVLLEGVAAGLPVVIADPDLAEMLPADGHMIADTPDARGLARALRMLRDDPQRRIEMRRAAIAHRSITAQRTHRDGLVAVYRDVIG